MLCTWLKSNKTTKFFNRLCFIQIIQNKSYPPINAKIGLISLPRDAIGELSTEKELKSILNEDENHWYEEREAEININDTEINEEKEIENETTNLNTASQNENPDNLMEILKISAKADDRNIIARDRRNVQGSGSAVFSFFKT